MSYDRPLPLLMYLGRALAAVLLAAALLAGSTRALVWGFGSEWIDPELSGPPQVFVWAEDDADFGGLSALLMAPDGGRLLVASDHAHFFEARITRVEGRIAGLSDVVETHSNAWQGTDPDTPFRSDLEALTRLPDGRLMQGFEHYARLQVVDAPGARPATAHAWDRFESLFGNQAFEALATLPDGRVLAILERALGPDAVQGLVQDAPDWTGPHPVPVTPGYMISGAELGPDGCLYTVERRYGWAGGFRFRVRRLWQEGGLWAQDRPWHATLLYAGAPATLGNPEGLSVWAAPGGDLVVTLVTDNGFWPLTPTRLIELPLAMPGSCR